MNKLNKVYLNFTINDITQLLKRREKKYLLVFHRDTLPEGGNLHWHSKN